MTDQERIKHLELKVENLELKYYALLQKVENLGRGSNPMAIVGAVFDQANEVYKSQGELIITVKEVNEICQRGHDLKYIDKIIDVIFKNYPKHYKTLSYAIKQWLLVDNTRPENENEYLLNEGFCPVAEQQRLFPGKAIKDMAYFQRKNEQTDWKEKEAQWRKELEEEDAKKTPEQKKKEKEDREKILNNKQVSMGMSDRMRKKIEDSGLNYDEFVKYSKGIKK